MEDNNTEPLPGTGTVATSPPVGPSYERQHAKVLRFEISVGANDDEHTIHSFEDAVRDALTYARDHGASVFVSGADELRFHNLTVLGGHYIIDGKVCLPQDYDPVTKNRKPGTFPPQWAGGPDPKKAGSIAAHVAEQADEPEEEKPHEFVRVQPTRSSERDPRTGRRVRSDKGVPRGPRTVPADKIDVKNAVAKMGEQFKEQNGG